MDTKLTELELKLVDLLEKRKPDVYGVVRSIVDAPPGSELYKKRELLETFYKENRDDPQIDAKLEGFIKAMVDDINGRSVSQASIQRRMSQVREAAARAKNRKSGQPASNPPSPPVSDPPSPSVSVSDASSPRSDTPPPYGSPPPPYGSPPPPYGSPPLAYSSTSGTPLQPATKPDVTVTEILNPQVVSGPSPPPPYASDTAVSGLPPPYTSATASPPTKPPKKKSTGCFDCGGPQNVSGGGSIIKKNKTKRRKKPTKRRKKPTKRIKKRTIRGHQRRTYKQSGGMDIPSERELQRELQEKAYNKLRILLSRDHEFGEKFSGVGKILTLNQYKILASNEYAGRFVGQSRHGLTQDERVQIREFLDNERQGRGAGAARAGRGEPSQGRSGRRSGRESGRSGRERESGRSGWESGRRSGRESGRSGWESGSRSGRESGRSGRESGRSGRESGSRSGRSGRRSDRSGGESSRQSKFLVPPTGDTTVRQSMRRYSGRDPDEKVVRQFMSPPSSDDTTVMFDGNAERRKIIERLTEYGTWEFLQGSGSPLLIFRKISPDGTFDMEPVYEKAADAEIYGPDPKYMYRGGADQFLKDKGLRFIHGGPQVSEPEPGPAETPDLILATKLDKQNRATEMILNRLKDQGAWKKTNGEECDDACLQAAASKEQSNSLGRYQYAEEYLKDLGYSAETELVIAEAVEPSVVIEAQPVGEKSPDPVTPVSDPGFPDDGGTPVSGPLVPERGAAATVPAGGSSPAPPYRGPQTAIQPTRRSRGFLGFGCGSKPRDVSGGGFIINKNKMKRRKKPTKRNKKQTRRYKRLR